MDNNISKYDLIMFDLDGTLAPSKSALEPAMAETLVKLLMKKKVAVISGGNYAQFQKQFVSKLPMSVGDFSNLYIMPVSGSCLYIWNGDWELQYAENLSPGEKVMIRQALDDSLKEAGFVPGEEKYGELIEDRGSQITFSALGQQAPIEAKKVWDPDRLKRQAIAKILAPKVPQFDVVIGGMTSIDITRKGVNKAYGIRKIEGYLKLSPEKILFVGDALFEGGNDFPAKSTGVDCKQVSGPEETIELIKSWCSTESQ